MKELESEFTGKGETKGFTFRKLAQNQNAFLYEVRTSHTAIHWEVFRKKENTQYNCISYPTSKAFGIWAWTLTNIEDAITKFNSL